MTFEQFIEAKLPTLDQSVPISLLKEVWDAAQNALLQEAIRSVIKGKEVPCVVISREELAEMDKDLAGLRVWLDDVRKMPEGYDVHVKTAEDAIKLIAEGRVSFMSFDYDLGFDMTLLASRPSLTGLDVAKYVEDGAAKGTIARFKWAVHSMSLEGAHQIKLTLRNADKFWDQAK